MPRDEKRCCLSSFYFSGPTWENAFLRRDAPVVGPGGTLEGTRGYLVSICRRDAPVEGRGHTSKGIQRGGAPRKGWRTPPAPPGVAHPVRGGAPLAWRTPPGVAHPARGGAPRKGWRTPPRGGAPRQGVAHPARGGAPRKGWRTPEGVPPLVPACVKPRLSSSGRVTV